MMMRLLSTARLESPLEMVSWRRLDITSWVQLCSAWPQSRDLPKQKHWVQPSLLDSERPKYPWEQEAHFLPTAVFLHGQAPVSSH